MLKKRELSDLIAYLKNKEESVLTYPYTKTLAEFSVMGAPFAYLETGSAVLRLSLKSDPILAKLLRNKYEEVSAGHKLDMRHWNTIVLSGQLSFSELTALIDHSYVLATQASHSKQTTS